MTPEVSGEYFDKISCFCFTTQHLGAHESAEWPVVFFLDPSLEKDESMARVDSITLSYTLFASPSQKPAPGARPTAPGPRADHEWEKAMTDAAIPDRPGFHLVEPSAWPIVGAAFALLSAFGLILFMHDSSSARDFWPLASRAFCSPCSAGGATSSPRPRAATTISLSVMA